jgi:hypothetical protein
MVYYAGIGSRETPESILNAFTKIGEELGNLGITLRSGRAPGADSAFERGARKAHQNSEIFVPWRGFPKGSDLASFPAIVFDRLENAQKLKAIESVRRYHPAPDRLSDGAFKLMARNYCQMFGPSVDSPASSFVVCWTRDGGATGGTGQAIRMAEEGDIPVLNAHGYENNPDAFVERVVSFARTLL